VPDGDDTAGAMISLMELQPKEQVTKAVLAGCDWLMKLQNNDGGFPTFSKGWGKLTFDKSCPDVTGHCVLAVSKSIHIYSGEISGRKRKRYDRMLARAVSYLKENQSGNGSWLPLWFGNQLTNGHLNPVYGTARVLTYLLDAGLHEQPAGRLNINITGMIRAATSFLLDARNEDGSWGGDKAVEGTIEETSLAVSALTGAEQWEACRKGLDWLDQYYRKNGLKPAPIGLYFASLWYHEKLYPLTMYLEAITRSLERDNQIFRSDL